MKNNEFLKHLQKKCNAKLVQGLTLDDLNIILKSLSEVVSEQITNGETVKILNIGQFRRVKREAREWRNPKTGNMENLKAKYSIHFSVSDTLKSEIEKEVITDG